jgi:nucleoside-diphosphate-sugar epimerase
MAMRWRKWLGYLSSTGVYGDARGGWVDESAPLLGRRPARNAPIRRGWRWARVFRLPGIYGPGRSALMRWRRAAHTGWMCRGRCSAAFMSRTLQAACWPRWAAMRPRRL